MSDSQCKNCRAAGEKLFLKGEKCTSPKCTLVKKPYAPGRLGATSRRRSPMTEFGKQLKEKQKVRNMYGLREEQFSRYVKKATQAQGVNPASVLFHKLESRLDNVVFRSGLAASRALARQMVAHGHILVNGRKVKIPSYEVKEGDIISVREGSREKKLFTDALQNLEKYEMPPWVAMDKKKLEGKMTGAPDMEHAQIPFDLAAVIEFYSR